jgi:hypothetical protein
VRATVTRGKNAGLTGEVKWYGADRFARSYGTTQPMRVGIRVEGEPKLRFLPAGSVEVVNPEPVDETAVRSEARSLARARAQGGHWRVA